jgi:hypothetical protein
VDSVEESLVSAFAMEVIPAVDGDEERQQRSREKIRGCDPVEAKVDKVFITRGLEENKILYIQLRTSFDNPVDDKALRQNEMHSRERVSDPGYRGFVLRTDQNGNNKPSKGNEYKKMKH